MHLGVKKFAHQILKEIVKIELILKNGWFKVILYYNK